MKWLLAGLAAWVLVSIPAGFAVARILGRLSRHDTPDPHHQEQ